jgi:hypothetical protein
LPQATDAAGISFDAPIARIVEAADALTPKRRE